MIVGPLVRLNDLIWICFSVAYRFKQISVAAGIVSTRDHPRQL
jgi:hypothetical protein